MATNQIIDEKARDLRALADELRTENASLGGQIDLLAEEVAGLARGGPRAKTSDFDIAGDEVGLPEADHHSLERIIQDSDLLPVFFLEQGALVQRAVARVVLTEPVQGLPPGSGWGTGSLVSPSLFLTNNHVVPGVDFMPKIRIQFNYQLGAQGIEQVSQSFEPDANGTFHTSEALDYTVMQLKPAPPQVAPSLPPGAQPTGAGPLQAPRAGDVWGWIPLHRAPNYQKGQHFNVIQHPDGRRKEVALQDNEISGLFENVVRYVTDTEPGSSGSPVFDNLWRIVALHHAGGDRDPQTGEWLNNEGIRIDRLVDDLAEHFADQPQILQELGI